MAHDSAIEGPNLTSEPAHRSCDTEFSTGCIVGLVGAAPGAQHHNAIVASHGKLAGGEAHEGHFKK